MPFIIESPLDLSIRPRGPSRRPAQPAVEHVDLDSAEVRIASSAAVIGGQPI
jgi:hypothetical protein